MERHLGMGTGEKPLTPVGKEKPLPVMGVHSCRSKI